MVAGCGRAVDANDDNSLTAPGRNAAGLTDAGRGADGVARTPALPACAWPASLDRRDAYTTECTATRTSGPYCVTLEGGGIHCGDACEPDEFAVSCGGPGPTEPPPLPSGCRALPSGPGGNNVGCCPCDVTATPPGGVADASTTPDAGASRKSDAGASRKSDAGASRKPDAGASTGIESVVLFGGGSFGEGLSLAGGDTWTWDGTAWTQHDVPGPQARTGAAAAALGGTVILFGGEPAQPAGASGFPLENDSWSWDGTAWTQLAGSVAPGPRYQPAMSSLGTSNIVLFGGYVGPLPEDSDTWVLTGTEWSRQTASGPVARSGAAMAQLGTSVVMLGGEGNDGENLGGTWVFDGVSWAQQEVENGPIQRSFSAMAALNGTIVMFGGLGTAEEVPLGDTWTWDGATWTPHDIPGPPARSGHSMATGPGGVVLFGGTGEGNVTPLGDTWTWDGSSWTQHDVPGPSARTGAAMAGLRSAQ